MAKFKLDEIDHQILDMLIDNTRIPFTDIAKKLVISAWNSFSLQNSPRTCSSQSDEEDVNRK